MRKFHLMNKDVPVLTFTIQNVMGVTSITINEIFTDKPLISLKAKRSLDSWLGSRLVLSYRTNVLTKLKKVL